MKLFEVRDLVRENVGRDKMSEHLLKWSLDMGLREIEKTGTYYWMRGTKLWHTVVNQQSYSLTTDGGDGSGLNLPNFKDIRILLTSDQTLPNPDWDEVYGPIDIEEAALEFSDTSEGMPIIYSLDELIFTGTTVDPIGSTPVNLLVWPPNPKHPDNNKTFTMRLHYYQWTSLPVDIKSDSHEVLKRWPEALIYLATEFGIVAVTKDPQFGTYWRLKFDNPGNRQDPGELTKIRRYNRDRAQDSRIQLRPFHGPLTNRRGKWRRNREIWI